MSDPAIEPTTESLDELADRLTAPQGRAITALLSNRTVEQASLACDVPTRTLFRWLSDDEDFRESYRLARASVVGHAITSLQAAAAESVEVLRSIMHNEDAPAHARVQAAKITLEVAVEAVRAESLERRIKLLEAREKAALKGRLR
jgi:alpha-beta hydrolase superfamily lysophospholipase